METLIQEITALHRSLSLHQQWSVTDAVSSYFGKPQSLTPEALAMLEHHELLIIRDTVNGLVLTNHAVQDIPQGKWGQSEDGVPRKVSFGRIENPWVLEDRAVPYSAGASGNWLSRKGIRCVFFDVDDTLYSQFDLTCIALKEVLTLPEHFPYIEAYRRIGYYSGKFSAEGDLLQASPQGERASRMREDRFIQGLAEFGIPISREQGARIQQAYSRLQGEMRLSAGAGELLTSLNELGMTVGIITNGNEEHQQSKLRTLGLNRYVPEERIMISSTVGFSKPDPRIFQLANTRTGMKAQDSLYIGDSWPKDIAGASAAGWHTIWFNPLQAVSGNGNRPEAIVSTFAELRELLGL
ncbi:HAD family hydrolase [Paenibacillus sp. P46E]|uniref:HAD family hydrolase n=1 Tax=Paenibacillus sp. P46E TaxID=1349436 RepID=UPI00095F6564|nr:HAD family hydrolase [Paenibacillus sp. P46E]OKP95569.1 hypothetical protein A3849_25370 [Paenibacillus sp. P46E]